jgi:large conductance mechanosensitive channel
MIKIRSRFEDFKNFAMKGNVLDLAVGVIIGGAFGKIVSSLVNDVVLPLIGLIAGRVDLSSLELKLNNAATHPLVLHYGSFLQSIIDFLIIAICIYVFIKLAGKLKRKQEIAEKAVVEPTQSEVLLTEIRDLLKEKRDK